MATTILNAGPNTEFATPEDLREKFNSSFAAPDFGESAYAVRTLVNHDGGLYRFIVPHAANTAWNNAEVEAIVLTTPDATLDISGSGALRVVAPDGTVLWQQGYNLKQTSSLTLDNETGNMYAFAVNTTDDATVLLPPIPAGKVAAFILDVANPALDDTVESWPTPFASTATYAVGAKVSYDSKIWKCTTKVETAGAWTGLDNWEEAIPSISLGTALDNTVSVVVGEGESLDDIFAVAPGTMKRIYFTLTAFRVNNLPTYWVSAKTVVNGGAQA